jgi:hypothetical protein
MSKIFLSRNREQLGEFTEEQVVHGLMNGRFFGSDLAWREGMEEWRPLSELDLVEKAVARPPEVGALEPLGVPSQQAAGSRGDIAWETTGEGWVGRWWQTTWSVIASPIRTFSAMPVTGGFGKPLLYYFVCGMLYGIVWGVFQVLLTLVMSAAGVATGEAETAALMGGSLACSIPLTLAIMVVASALGVVIGAFVGGGIVHVCLMLLGAANRGYEASVRAVCYCGGAVNTVSIVPILGWLAAALWGPVVYVIALKEAHKTDYWRVIIAVLLPLIVCCGAGFVLASAMGGLALLTGQSQ